MLAVRASALLLAALCLGACGSEQAIDSAGGASPSAPPSTGAPSADSSDEPSTEPTDEESEPVPDGAPECAEVWADGAQLPRSYRGCVADGAYVPRDVLSCSSGQRMIRQADRYYGVLGGTIHEASGSLEQDRDYRAAIRRCRA